MEYYSKILNGIGDLKKDLRGKKHKLEMSQDKNLKYFNLFDERKFSDENLKSDSKLRFCGSGHSFGSHR